MTAPGSMDHWPELEPNRFNYRPLDGRKSSELSHEMVDEWKANGSLPEHARFTIINENTPNPPYPYGVYAEGWDTKPWKLDPPHREAAFNFPLTFLPDAPDGGAA